MIGQDEQMAALHRRFLVEAEADCSVCRGALEDGDFELLRRSAHRLAGRGGMFGYPKVSKAAERLEDALLASAGRETIALLGGELLTCLQQLNQEREGS